MINLDLLQHETGFPEKATVEIRVTGTRCDCLIQGQHDSLLQAFSLLVQNLSSSGISDNAMTAAFYRALCESKNQRIGGLS